MSISTTRDITSYLRGFAISVVLINHYVNGYVSVNFTGYATGVIALFFVLSGYGIFHSLQGKLNQEGTRVSPRALLAFYWSRALRIFPLYWLYLLGFVLFFDTVPPLSAFFGSPLQLAPGIAWFVTLLIQCYLLAPFLYILLKKVGTGKYVVIVLTLLFLLYMVSLFGPLPYYGVFEHYPFAFAYRHFFIGHIFLFSLGMALPNIIAVAPRAPANRILALLSFALFFVTVYYTRFRFGIYVAPFFILSTFATCLYAILWNPKPPLARILILLGIYSYSIFLFHIFFYQALKKLGIIQYGDPQSVIFMLLLLPIFILICIITEKYTNRIVGRLSNWASRWSIFRRHY